MHTNTHGWERYVGHEMARVKPLLEDWGYTLDANQPHLRGERFLMRALTTTSGKKLILLGHTEMGTRVVIKATSDSAGKQELMHERECRRVLHQIRFAYDTFFSPEEVLFTTQNDLMISIQKYVPHERPFLERPTPEQFSLALKAFKAQESAHATTYEHERLISRTFGSIDADGYLRTFREFGERCTTALHLDQTLAGTYAEALHKLECGKHTIEQYCGFLTHVDFVPHNFRVNGNEIYLLDHSSLRFGNKYEGWARFLNFMMLYNRELEDALLFYVRENRSAGELESLNLMRIYRLGEIICYYVETLAHVTADLHHLNIKRVQFWHHALRAQLNGTRLQTSLIEIYRHERDALRSDDEKERQVGLH